MRTCLSCCSTSARAANAPYNTKHRAKVYKKHESTRTPFLRFPLPAGGTERARGSVPLASAGGTLWRGATRARTCVISVRLGRCPQWGAQPRVREVRYRAAARCACIQGTRWREPLHCVRRLRHPIGNRPLPAQRPPQRRQSQLQQASEFPLCCPLSIVVVQIPQVLLRVRDKSAAH